MAVNLNRLRKFYVSAATKEASYGTAAVVDSLIKLETAGSAELTPSIANDQDLLGGTEEPGDQEILARYWQVPFNIPRIKPHALAFWAAYALGSVTTTTPAGGTTARKHTFTPLANNPVMPSFTLEEYVKSGEQNQLSGGMFDGGTLSVARGANRRVALQSNILCGGSLAAGSRTVTEKSEAALDAALTTGVWLGAVTYSGSTDNDLDTTSTDLSGSPTAIKSYVRSIEWRFNNNPDAEDLYRLGAGLGFAAAERMERTQTLTLNYDYQDDTEQTRLTSQTEVAFQWKIRGAQIESGFYYGMNLIFPKLQLTTARRGVDRGKLVNQLEFQVLEDTTFGSVILDVFNVQTAYAG